MFQNEQRITITARDLKVVSALQCDGRMTMQALGRQGRHFRIRGYGKLPQAY